MSLAPFFSRIASSLGPYVSSSELASFLEKKSVGLLAPDNLIDDAEHFESYLFAVNLCARLYPKLRLCGPRSLVDQASQIALEINPHCELDTTQGPADATLGFRLEERSKADSVVCGSGWNAAVNWKDLQPLERTNSLTTLAAATLGVGELFKKVFSRYLSDSAQASPIVFNLVKGTCEWADGLPGLSPTDLGRFHLAGAGAIGQSMIHVLSRINVSGECHIVDPEQIELSNLQRYVLARFKDVGSLKTELAVASLKDSALKATSVSTHWGADDRSTKEVETVCTALDTGADRIAVQTGLPRIILNAWTQPADIGWSRHEQFGILPCLACLYLPAGEKPSLHQLIARAVKQPEVRVLGYLTNNWPIDQPLPPELLPQLPSYPLPSNANQWTERSLLADVIELLGLPPETTAPWKNRLIDELYREGICGGAIVSSQLGQMNEDVLVPLAHQSALAGIMLATQLVIRRSAQLHALRPEITEGRLDVLKSMPQITLRPRQRTAGCICDDRHYLARYDAKWNQ